MERFEVVDFTEGGTVDDLTGIAVRDNGRELMVAVRIIDLEHANTIRDALTAGCAP